MSENERGAANPEESEPRELTFGEDAVGLKFNPSGNEKVDKIKNLYAEVIDLLNEERSNGESNRHPEKNRILSYAITDAEKAQMSAVKGLTK